MGRLLNHLLPGRTAIRTQGTLRSSRARRRRNLPKVQHSNATSIRPVTAFVVVTSFISAAQLFDEPYLLTKGGPGESTLSVAMFIFRAAFERQQFGYAAAAGIILFVLVFSISQLLNRALSIGKTS